MRLRPCRCILSQLCLSQLCHERWVSRPRLYVGSNERFLTWWYGFGVRHRLGNYVVGLCALRLYSARRVAGVFGIRQSLEVCPGFPWL